MKDLIYITLSLKNSFKDFLVNKEKLDEAVESIIADNKWRNETMAIHLNHAVESITGIIVKGSYIGIYDISKWI